MLTAPSHPHSVVSPTRNQFSLTSRSQTLLRTLGRGVDHGQRAVCCLHPTVRTNHSAAFGDMQPDVWGFECEWRVNSLKCEKSEKCLELRASKHWKSKACVQQGQTKCHFGDHSIANVNDWLIAAQQATLWSPSLRVERGD